jgi:trigger factor
VAELVDALDLGSSGATCESSSLSFRTIFINTGDFMKISVTKTNAGNLERKITIEVPAEQVHEAENKKLQKVGATARIDGFRKGKIPLKVLKEQYGEGARHEAMDEVIRKTLFEAFKQEKINPAGMPKIEDMKLEEGKPFIYTAIFELFPEIKLNPFKKLKVEKIVSQVTDKDLEHTLDLIRKQNGEFEEVERAAKEGDKVVIDFEGSVKGEKFEGGTAKDYTVELGNKQMLPDFEEGIIGMKTGEEKTIKVKFPKDYGEKTLAGEKAEFIIKLHKVEAVKLPALDQEFAEKLGVPDGVEALKADVRKNMERQLEKTLQQNLKEAVFEALIEENKFDVPNALVEEEMERYRENFKQKFAQYGDMADQLFERSKDGFLEKSKRNAALGLIVQEIMKDTEIKVEESRVRKMIETLSEAYEKPDEIVKAYYDNKDHLNHIRSLVLEDQLIEKILEEAKVTEKKQAFHDVVKPQHNQH